MTGVNALASAVDDSSMIVAGAFGHNRLREMLLGSVTRELIKKSPVPLLLAH